MAGLMEKLWYAYETENVEDVNKAIEEINFRVKERTLQQEVGMTLIESLEELKDE